MILVIRRNLQVTAFTWLVDCTMDSFIEAVANLLRIHGDDFHVCSSQFQSFQSFNRFAPFITGISPFQTFQTFNRCAPFKRSGQRPFQEFRSSSCSNGPGPQTKDLELAA